MEAKIIDLPKLYFVGLKAESTMNEINTVGPAIWEKLMTNFPELDQNEDLICLGVCINQESCSENATFTYMAGYASKEPIERLEGLISHEISACKYAVFTHKGSVMTLGETFDYAYKEWLPNSEYKKVQHEDLELYDGRFDESNPKDSELDIFIPIQ